MNCKPVIEVWLISTFCVKLVLLTQLEQKLVVTAEGEAITEMQGYTRRYAYNQL